jgi:hypothetical protein
MVSDDEGSEPTGTTTTALGSHATSISLRLRSVAAAARPALDRLDAIVHERLRGIPPECRQPAPSTIAAPAALQYALLGDGDDVAELREMFENLLVAAMDRNTAASAHPAFAAMISQLMPDEARILRSIDRRRYAALNLFEATSEGATLTESLIGFRTLLGLDTGIDESRHQQYLSNLSRLSIIRFDWGDSLHPNNERKELERRVNSEFPMRSLSIYYGTISINLLGWQFLDTCVRSRGR